MDDDVDNVVKVGTFLPASPVILGFQSAADFVRRRLAEGMQRHLYAAEQYARYGWVREWDANPFPRFTLGLPSLPPLNLRERMVDWALDHRVAGRIASKLTWVAALDAAVGRLAERLDEWDDRKRRETFRDLVGHRDVGLFQISTPGDAVTYDRVVGLATEDTPAGGLASLNLAPPPRAAQSIASQPSVWRGWKRPEPGW